MLACMNNQILFDPCNNYGKKKKRLDCLRQTQFFSLGVCFNVTKVPNTHDIIFLF